MFGPLYQLRANPGDYELKVLRNNHLARSIKFTVGSDGKFDNGIAAANKLGSNRDEDGPWNRAAWKTDAFYGNPLTAFTPSPHRSTDCPVCAGAAFPQTGQSVLLLSGRRLVRTIRTERRGVRQKERNYEA
jgi:hypothetical protein